MAAPLPEEDPRMRGFDRYARAPGAFAALTLLASLLAPGEAAATAIVRVVPTSPTMAVGEPGVRDPGGLHAAGPGVRPRPGVRPGPVERGRPPQVGPLFVALFAPDGDGLAGLADVGPVSGSDVLLATLQVAALAPGVAMVVAGFTGGDLTEGFPLDPTGFEPDVQFVGAVVTVAEPGLSGFIGLAALLLCCRPRPRSRRS